MELVQAPPLSELPSLTADFKVADESLAGFVKDETKVFSTTIRPRREGITEIPAIRFSFFDPDTESYKTVSSRPIAITVNKSESLALDAIVGNSRTSGDREDAASTGGGGRTPDFSNSDARSVLVSHPPMAERQWWWMFVIAPPLVWLATLLVRYRNSISDRLPSFKSAQRRCLVAIESAADTASIAEALRQYIARRSGKPCATTSSAIGVLRVSGMYEVANEAESYLQRLQRAVPGISAPGSAEEGWREFTAYQQQAVALTEKLESSFSAMNRSGVRLAKGRAAKASVGGTVARSLGLPLAVAIALSAPSVGASEAVALSTTQQETILKEASQTYVQATALEETNSADAKELFETAAGKYQLLVDSGIQNSELYANLGNAYLQSGELGRAIANYERARQLNPRNQQVLANLRFANSRVQDQPSTVTDIATGSFAQRLRSANDTVVQFVGMRWLAWTLAIASLTFWGLLIARTAGPRFPVWRIAAIPLLILIVSLGSVVLTETDTMNKLDGVIVADNVGLHAGDGEQFDKVFSINAAQGQRIEVLAERGDWTQVRTAGNHIGWVRSEDIEVPLARMMQPSPPFRFTKGNE